MKLVLPFTLIVACMAFVLQPDRPFLPGVQKGALEDPAIQEASGLEASRTNPGMLWTHNDSGDEARIFLLDSTAKRVATYYLEGVNARDWEEIGAADINGKRCLLIGDIGDNRAQYGEIYVHRVAEPFWDRAHTGVTDTIHKQDILSYKLRYPDGPRDAESLFFDPSGQELYVISKRELNVGIYKTPLPDHPDGVLTLKKVGTLPYTFITSAAISARGDEILVKNLVEVFYWKRLPEQSIEEVLQQGGIRLDYEPEPQGEAIAFSIDGRGFYTTSERPLGLNAYLSYYQRK